MLTILGVIMFLRLSTVVGNAGLWSSLLIVLCASSITFITSLSISSIATNMRVQGGGAYYLISRSLGVEFGGVIAMFFYIAQTVAVTLYVIGFTEAVQSAFPDMPFPFRAFASLTNIAVFLCVYIGAGWTIKLQYFILGVLFISIASFMFGAVIDFDPAVLRANLDQSWMEGESFFTIFALFFPAVTGIMAGVNMSGDLKDPSRSLPRGTLAAVLISTLIYTSLVVVLAGAVPREFLQGEGFVMKNRAMFPSLVYAGVISATLSSALGSMMGAPRILQAFARDGIFKRMRWFARGSGPAAEPRRAIIVTFLIAQVGIMAGDLNTIAPIITMFFLLTYGTVNLACFYELSAANPSFRPTFKLNHRFISLLGALGCLAVMFLIDTLAAGIAIAVSSLFYWLIKRADLRVRWGDVGAGRFYQKARTALIGLQQEVYHPKNWRPSILVLSGGAYNRLHLAEYACWFTADSGVVSIAQVIRGRLEDLFDRRHEAEDILRKFIIEEDLPAFPAVLVEENIHEAVKALLQCHGLGALRPNTVMFGLSGNPDNYEMFLGMLQMVKAMRRSLIVVKCQQKQEKVEIPDGAINVWWNDSENAALMLLMAHLLRRNPEWSRHRLRIIRPAPPRADIANIESELRAMMASARLEAELLVIPTHNPRATVLSAMQPSAVLFAGFDPEQTDINRLRELAELPGDVVLVYNSGDASLIS
jgi:amino acid transporter